MVWWVCIWKGESKVREREYYILDIELEGGREGGRKEGWREEEGGEEGEDEKEKGGVV